jgi:uncharacterized protein (UPF0332 family)
LKEATAKRLTKAEAAIRAAEILLGADHSDFAAGRAYYAMFYSAEALLFEQGLRFRTHGDVHGAFGQHFSKTGVLPRELHQWLLVGYDQRITGDYWTDSSVSTEEVQEMIEHARQFLDETRRYLEGH